MTRRYAPQMTPGDATRPYDPLANPLYPPAVVTPLPAPMKGREWERYLDTDERAHAIRITRATVTERGGQLWLSYMLAGNHLPQLLVCTVHTDGGIVRIGTHNQPAVHFRAIIMDYLATHGKGLLA